MKTIFFDFGNVLAFFDHQRAIRRLHAYTDLSPDELTVVLYGSPIEDRYETNHLSTAEYVRLGKEHGRLNCPDDVFLAAFVDIFWKNDEVCDVIPRLKPRYRLVLASNTNDAHYRKYTEQFADVLTHFDHLCPSHLAGHRKPHPEYFTYCQRFADADPADCLFIDDIEQNIAAARRHGWQGVCYRPDGTFASQLRAAGIAIS